jgi:AraC-like DNA-binding protein
MSDLPTSEYRETPPPAPLREALVCTWTQAVGAGRADYAQRVMPDGCVDVVFIGDAPPLVVGPMTRAETSLLAPGTLLTGARFRPGHAAAVLSAPASALVDAAVPLRDLWGRAAASTWDAVTDTASADARQAALTAVLLRRMADARTPDGAMAAAARWLTRNPGGRVERVAEMLGMGERQLRRRFAEAVGYAPKTFQRIARFQRALHLAGAHPERGLAALALDAGYADQAHMTREVRALSGATPAALFPRAAATLDVADLLADPRGGRRPP